MGLLVECPKCKQRNSPKKPSCKCGKELRKLGHKTYWIEYYNDAGRRKRERIGPSKAAAEQRYREILMARTEGRYITRDKAAKTSLGELFEWYKTLPDVKSKKTYKKEFSSIKNLLRLLGSSTKIKALTLGKVEEYRSIRLFEPSPRHPGENVRKSSVNREISCLMGMLNRAVRHGKLNLNPIAQLKKLPENNVRQRILTQEEFGRLVSECPDHLKPMVILAYYLGMRKSEVTFLTWKEVDLEKGFIRLKRGRTKTETARDVPLHPRVIQELRRIPRAIHTDRVFLYKGKPVNDPKRSFQKAYERAGLGDFTFHDLRHCAVNNLRLANHNDYFKVMAVSGHKTISVFQRYNLVTEEELSSIAWRDVIDDEIK